jgi:predicted metal-dependent enzyme (double-stranded beta helix superfamily)
MIATHPTIDRRAAGRLLLLPPDLRELNRVAVLPPLLALRRATPLLARLVAGHADLLAYPHHSRPLQGLGDEPDIIWQRTSRDGSWSLGLFAWPAGAQTAIHDHTSWGIYHCVAGSLVEERYERLDDATRPEHARLRLAWRRRWEPGDSSTLLPYDGGIHRVAVHGDAPAWSVHLYGPRLGLIDGRDYDPTRDYVCDRPA